MALPGFESTPRYSELLYRLLTEDLDFIPPGFILENDRPEWAFLKREVLWESQPVTVAAVVGQLGFYQIFNPATSKFLLVVTHFFATVGVAATVTNALTVTVRGASGGAQMIARDTRWNPPGGITYSVLQNQVTTGTAVNFGTDTPLGNFGLTGPTIQLPFPPVIVEPGFGIVLSCGTANTAFGAWMAGYARTARPEELSD